MSDSVEFDVDGEITSVRGEAFAISERRGDVLPGSHLGFYVRDVRFLDRLEVRIDGVRPRPLSGYLMGSAAAAFHSYVVQPDTGPDPTLLVTRHRLIDGSMHEDISIDNRGRQPAKFTLDVVAGTDFAYIFDVRHHRQGEAVTPEPIEDGLCFRRGDEVHETAVVTSRTPDEIIGDTLRFRCHVAPAGTVALCVEVRVSDVYGTAEPRQRCDAFPSAAVAPDGDEADAATAGTRRTTVQFGCSDVRFERLVRRSLDDVGALTMADPMSPHDVFCAAGSPWYLTLFGRDSVWTAFMLAPFDLELARGTLRTLARRQGTKHDPDTEEAPGKILHEIRRGSLIHRGDLPPNYYGTVDATPLFVVLAHEAWRCGLADDDLAPLIDNVEAALHWMRSDGDSDGDGFLEYRCTNERGLANQGWKDSADGIQFADGRLADAPIALSEVQGYAYAAATRGAELLDHFGRAGGDDLRSYAAALARRFGEAFWIADELGSYPAIALDRDKVPVTGPASNMGHLLSTGILDEADCRSVGACLQDDTLASGWGLRTLTTRAKGYNPVSYHAGSVWPHDTAIAVWGLAETGQRDAAVSLLEGLVNVAPFFRHRLPELFSGYPRRFEGAPIPYPAACRPQAWAAGGALLLLRACLGLHPDLPHGGLQLRPLWPPPFASLRVGGLRLGGALLDLEVTAERGVEVRVSDRPLRVDVVLPADAPPATVRHDPTLVGPGMRPD